MIQEVFELIWMLLFKKGTISSKEYDDLLFATKVADLRLLTDTIKSM